jgi:dephospho-CoA kinase
MLNEQIEAEKFDRKLKQTLLQNDLRNDETEREASNKQIKNCDRHEVVRSQETPKKTGARYRCLRQIHLLEETWQEALLCRVVPIEVEEKVFFLSRHYSSATRKSKNASNSLQTNCCIGPIHLYDFENLPGI